MVSGSAFLKNDKAFFGGGGSRPYPPLHSRFASVVKDNFYKST